MNEATKRFLQAVSHLLSNGKIKSNRELAGKMGISPSFITELTKGRSSITLKKIRKLTDLYSELNIEYLIEGKGDLILTKKDARAYSYSNEVEYLKVLLKSKDEMIESQRETIDVLKRELKSCGQKDEKERTGTSE